MTSPLVADLSSDKDAEHYYIASPLTNGTAAGRGTSAFGDRRSMRISIIQTAYIPWRGFFSLIGSCDEYVIFDRVQYRKRHWHNRNRIKTASGPQFLTIPVITKGRFLQPIEEVEVGRHWAERHWRSIELAYKRAPFFELLGPTIRNWYEEASRKTLLTDINAFFLHKIAAMLRLDTRIVRDTMYPAQGAKTARLLGIVQAAGADRYLSGPSAKAYLDEAMFTRAGIAVEWMDYSTQPTYPQLYGPFDPSMSTIDLLFNVGDRGPAYLSRLARPDTPKTDD